MLNKQIDLKNGYNDNLTGKVIDKVAFNRNRLYSDEEQLIITFTDNTYIAVSIEYDDLNKEHYIENLCPLNILSYSKPPCRVLSDGTVIFDTHIKQQLDLNIIEPIPDDTIKNIIEEHNKCEVEREYHLYLKLKEKFEK